MSERRPVADGSYSTVAREVAKLTDARRTPGAFESYRSSTLADLHPLSQQGRRMHRHFFSGASEQTPDKQGRVSIPPALTTHAKLGRDVVVAGVNDHLEIWGRAAWKRELAEVEGSAEDVAERLAAQGS